MQIGSKVKVVRRRNPLWGNCCVGMEGNITEIDETAFTDWEKRNHSERKLKVVATNLGPLAKGDNGGEKMVYRWKPGEHATFYEEELLKINE